MVEFIVEDDVIEELHIPIDIINNTSIKSYKVMDKDKVIYYYERVETPLDKPAKVEQTTIIEKPMFFGKWVDKTQEYILNNQKS